MAIPIIPIFNRIKNQVYPVTHAKGVIRGESNIDSDLTVLEESAVIIDPSENGGNTEETVQSLIDLQNQILVMQGRISEAITNVNNNTVDNAEVLDIRVGYDGTTHITAGDAVRNQISTINSKINSHIDSRILSSTGLHGIRFYGGHLQYNDTTTSTWIDIISTNGVSTNIITNDALLKETGLAGIRFYNNKLQYLNLTNGTWEDIITQNNPVSSNALLTEDGLGGIRYFNNKLQSYDTNTSTWEDIVDVTNTFLSEDGYKGLRYFNNKLQNYDTNTSTWEDIVDEDSTTTFLTEIGYKGLRYFNNKLQNYDTNTSTWIDINTMEEIPATFLSENGVGNIRYYCNNFQYYDTATSTWKDMNVNVKMPAEASFLTTDGLGNLRFYNGNLQYKNGEEWVDTQITADNTYFVSMYPLPMEKFSVQYNVDISRFELRWIESLDTIYDNQLFSVVEGIKIVRKQNGIPSNVTDGTLVLDVQRKDFGKHEHTPYVDTSFSPALGSKWYYRAFPYNTEGKYNMSSINYSGATCKDYYLYGIVINQNESDPDNMISYIEDNAYFNSAKMNYEKGEFDYGDWENAFFMPKPCMLKYDGTVDYYLNPLDYSQKLNGGASDISNTSYTGNAMMEWGQNGYKIWTKYVPSEDGNSCTIYICSRQLDSTYKAYSFINNANILVSHFYTPIYNGSLISSTLRSLSNQKCLYNTTASQEVTYAKANNKTADILWYTETFSDRTLINTLLLLMGKSTDTQSVFGTGDDSTYVNSSATDYGLLNSGSMDNKGLFYGYNDHSSGVKIFGMENWWGNTSRRIAGNIVNNGIQKIKMTYGNSDGSIATSYNLDGTNYITIADSLPIVSAIGYISKMKFTENGLIPKECIGSQSTYYADRLYFNNSINAYSAMGGDCSIGGGVGALCNILTINNATSGWNLNASISCKPLT